LAEDNNEARTGTKYMLEELGYKVIEAVDGEDAINRFKMGKDEIHLVVLDVIMPKKNGKEVYADIKKIKPEIPAIFTSGYTADIIRRQGRLAEGIEFIAKPVAPQVLSRKIREILDRKKE
jgi:CheY-like chemotaxis protein